MPTVRGLARRLVELAAVHSGIARARIGGDPSGVAVLAFHNIVPNGEAPVGERSLHLPQSTFGTFLDALTRTHDVVSLREAFRETSDSATRPRAVVTFDDAYDGAITAGFEELEKRALPSTMFVAPGLLGSEGFWWDRVRDTRRPQLEGGFRTFALDRLEGRHDKIMRWAATNDLSIQDLPAHARPTTASRLVNAARSAGVALAPHTWSHPNLAALSTDEAVREIATSRQWVVDTRVVQANWLAYPYGLCSESVRHAVRDQMDGALLIAGGLARRRGHWIGGIAARPRINIPNGLTTEGLGLRLAGWLESSGS